jgi:hypothetical protein
MLNDQTLVIQNVLNVYQWLVMLGLVQYFYWIESLMMMFWRQEV